MKNILLTLMVFGIVGCSKSVSDTPLCKNTFLGFVGYFHNCQTIKYKLDTGATYTGTWQNNKMHGTGFLSGKFGKMTRSGKWVKGIAHGQHLIISDESYMSYTYDMGELIDSKFTPRSNSNKTIETIPGINSPNSSSALIDFGNALLNGNNKPSRQKKNTPMVTGQNYSFVTTVPSNQNCPITASFLVKQEVNRGNKICYYQ